MQSLVVLSHACWLAQAQAEVSSRVQAQHAPLLLVSLAML